MKIRFLQKRLALLVLFSMVFSLLLVPAAGRAADVEVDVAALPTSADAAIVTDSAKPEVADTNYDNRTNLGSSTLGLYSLSTSSSKKTEVYFKFDVSTVSDSTYKYYLQVSAKKGSSDIDTGLQVYGLLNNSWQESTITWNNAPQTDLSAMNPLGQFIVNQANSAKPILYTVDVTDYVRQHLSDQKVSFIIASNSTNSVNVYSKENTSASNPEPQLLVRRVVQSDNTPPTWGQNATLKSINLGMDFVQLTWPAAIDDSAVSNYKLYQNDVLLSNVTGNTYTVQGLTPNTSVTYSVYAGDAVGNYSLTPLTYNVTTLSAPVTPLQVVEVNASSSDGNVESNTLDNNLFSRWSASGDGQYVMFDLGQPKNIGYVGIAFYKGDLRTTLIDIQTSNDAQTWTNVFTGNSRPNTVNMQAFDIPDTQARFVRIIGHGNSDGSTFTSLTEVMIYPPFPSGDTPVAIVPNITPTAPPGTVPFTKPGLTKPDGSEHAVHSPHQVTGVTRNVLDYGADPGDNAQDDRIAIQNAIDAATAGDEVFIPNGVYNLMTSPDGFINLKLKSGVNLRGESEAQTILKSSIDDVKNSSVLKSSSQHDILVSNLTVTSTWNRAFSLDHVINNPAAGGPDSMIAIANYGEDPSYNVTVDHVTVERFRRMAIRIENSHDVVVRHATFRNATDLGGGGAGYGTSIQGMPKVDRLGFDNDTYWNLVEDSTFEGPYLRHGSLIQNVAHNNVLRNNHYKNTKLDAIDLHGELEYLNEVYGNTVEDIFTGGGVGLGNTGGTAPSNHSKTGPQNYIHDNVIRNAREGIVVTMGTPDTRIEHNIIENTTTVNNGVGINILNGPGTRIENNIIRNNTASGYWGILLEHDNGDQNAGGIGTGDPQNVQIIGNTITGNTYGIQLQKGTNISVIKNILDNLGTNYLKASGVTATEVWPSTTTQDANDRDDKGASPYSPASGGSTLTPSAKLFTKVSEVNGKTTVTASVDTQAVEAITKAQGNGPVTLVVETPDSTEQVQVNLTKSALDKLLEVPSVRIDSPIGGLKLPVKQLLSEQFATLEVSITTNDSASAQAQAAGLQVVTSMDFAMKAVSSDGQSVDIHDFNQYVPYTLKVENGTLAERNLAAARVVQDANGNVSYEPVPFTVQAGEVTIYGRANGTFILIENQVSFGDTATHWAKDEIEQMANKWLVQGISKEEFGPDQPVTRAELAAMIVRTLGIKSSGDDAPFKDMNAKEWYNNAVNAAVKAGIITGYEDGTFRPEQTITRQEMAVMMNRALLAAGYNEQKAQGEPPSYEDQKQIQPWSQEAIDHLGKLKLMEGTSSSSFDPDMEATRAQSAVLLLRVLQALTFTN
ncbi:S-layer homology domain-containing protein [Paenibacillus sp. WC2504]|uniref:S-layer homology domain-containing protein n=1 Tax=Paenibacillus sp. WC2504 TaxID=3461403 RepID=UPI00404667DA